MLKNESKNNKSPKDSIFLVLRQKAYIKLYKKYTSGNYSYSKILANNVIFNDTCRIVARFKDYLIFDDNTEFLRRFYSNDESHPRLERILTFYEKYSKIFPNYMILKESKYLYRNIRKKQKMIDAVNEIKKEEEENRKKMRQNNNLNKDNNELFTKKVKEEIKTFQENTTFRKYRNQFDSDNEEENESSFSISVMNKKMILENIDQKLSTGVLNITEEGEKKNSSINESFIENETSHSISGILNVLNDNKIYTNDLTKLLEFNNYSKNSEKLKNNQKKLVESKVKENLTEKINSKTNQLFSPNNNLINKKSEISSNQLNKKISNNSNLVNNNLNEIYLSSKTFKKVSTPSTSSGTAFLSNTEKNLNEINPFQNLIIPKGNSIINVNNNYFEKVASSTCPMGYYTNHKLKKSNNNISNNNINNSTVGKSDSKNNYNSSTNNVKNEKERKFQQQNSLKNNNTNNNNEEKLPKNSIKKPQNFHDYIYQKNPNLAKIKFNKNEKNKKINNEKDEKIMKENNTKLSSFSPQPNNSNINTEEKKIPESNNLKKEKNTHNKFFNEKNDPNLITGDEKVDEDDEDDNKEREKLLLYIRDLTENKMKENNKNNTSLSYKNKKIKNTSNEKENNFTINTKFRTISNFNIENPNTSNTEKKNVHKNKLKEKFLYNNEIMFKTNDNLFSRKKLNDNKKEENYKKDKMKTKIGLRKLQEKEKKNRTKDILKNNKTKNNYNTSSKLYKEKNKNFYKKAKNNFKGIKNLFNNSKQENSIKQFESNNKILIKSKLLKKEDNQIEKTNKSAIEIPPEKENEDLSHSILFKSSNLQLSKLLMSQKKEENYNNKINTKSKIYHKGKIKRIKYDKNNTKFDSLLHNIDINNSYNNHLKNNSVNYKNDSKELTEYSNKNANFNINTNNTNNNTTKTLTRTHNMNNSDMKNKYKSSLVKKNKQKSCESENVSLIQQKINQELLERMSFIKKNDNNNFYQNYKENKAKLEGIKNIIGNSIGSSFDNLCNSAFLGNTQNNERKSVNLENGEFQSPPTGNKKIRLYKKVISKKPKLTKTDKKSVNSNGKNFGTSNAIKVNRSRFLEKVKDKNHDNNYINSNKKANVSNFYSCFNHKKF